MGNRKSTDARRIAHENKMRERARSDARKQQRTAKQFARTVTS